MRRKTDFPAHGNTNKIRCAKRTCFEGIPLNEQREYDSFDNWNSCWCRNKSVQKFVSAEVRQCRSLSVQEFVSAEVPKCRSFSVQKFLVQMFSVHTE